MIEGDKVTINDMVYVYSASYLRLERSGGADSRSHPDIACPKCHGTVFSIVYGDYECIADCTCGHSMVIYDG
jgi:hypothetical protein